MDCPRGYLTLFALTTIGSQFAARRVTNEMSKWGEKVEKFE